MASNSTPVGSYGTWKIDVDKIGGDGVSYSIVRVRGTMISSSSSRSYNNTGVSVGISGEQSWSGSSKFDIPARGSQVVLEVNVTIWHTAAKYVSFTATLGATGTTTFGTGGSVSAGITLPANITAPAAPTTPSALWVTNTAIGVDINDGADGGSAITTRQIGYSTTNDSSTAVWVDADANGSFGLGGLSPVTTYYFWGRVWNSVGASQISAVLAVTTLNLPSAPSTPTVSGVTNAGFTVDINDGADGGSAITTRQIGISQTPDSATAGWSNADANGTLVVTGKTPKTVYYLWGRTANAFGVGAVSARGSVQTHDVPDAPTLPTISNLTQVSALITFTDGGENGSAITGRRLGWSGESGSGAPTTVVTADSQTQLNGLPPGSRVYVWASIRNVYGWGPWSSRAQFDTLAGAYVTVSGVRKKAVPYLKVGGTWKLVKVWVKSFGVWRACG